MIYGGYNTVINRFVKRIYVKNLEILLCMRIFPVRFAPINLRAEETGRLGPAGAGLE